MFTFGRLFGLLFLSFGLTRLHAEETSHHWQLTLAYHGEELELVKASVISPDVRTVRSPGLEGAPLRIPYIVEWLDGAGRVVHTAPTELPLGRRTIHLSTGLQPHDVSIAQEGVMVIRLAGPDTDTDIRSLRLMRLGESPSTGSSALAAMGVPAAFTATERRLPFGPFANAVDPSAAGPIAVTRIKNAGPDADRFVLVIENDGFTQADLNTGRYQTECERIVAYMRTNWPWSGYDTAYNVYRIDIESNESGVDYEDASPTNGGHTVDNYLDTQFWRGGTQRCIYPTADGELRAIEAADRMVGVGVWHEIIILANSTLRGGCASSFAAMSLVSDVDDTAVHELGHSFANLRDEYDYGSSETNCYDTWDVNIDCNEWINSPKWSAWLTPGVPLPTPDLPEYDHVIGAFEGAFHQAKGYVRPRRTCRMRAGYKPFCEICAEAHIVQFVSFAGLTASNAPNRGLINIPIDGERTFRVSPHPYGHMRFQWRRNKQPLSFMTNNSFRLVGSSMGFGTHTLDVVVAHSTPHVRQHTLTTNIEWTVRLAFPSPYTNMAVAGTFNGWNTRATNLQMYGNNLWIGEMTFRHVYGAQFKFAANSGWTTNWGDASQGRLAVPISDIADRGVANNIRFDTALNGRYRFTFNDATRAYRVDRLGGSGKSVNWAGNAYHWPPNGSLTYTNDLWVNFETWPAGHAESAEVVYTTNNSEWIWAPMTQGPIRGNNDSWYVNLGNHGPGTSVRYACVVVDGNGAESWANNGGRNYEANVNGEPTIKWVGNIHHYPPDADWKGQEIWVNADTWPIGAGIRATLLYSLSGGNSWTNVEMKVEVKGNNNHWYVKLPAFGPGVQIHYAVKLEDANGIITLDDNRGRYYIATARP